MRTSSTDRVRHLKGRGLEQSYVRRPWVNGMDMTRRPADKWIVDFGWDMSEAEAALYESTLRARQGMRLAGPTAEPGFGSQKVLVET